MSGTTTAQLSIANARFVAVSATIPNINDIAAWLRVPPGGLHVFGQEHRPCKLHTIVRGYNMPSKVRQLRCGMLLLRPPVSLRLAHAAHRRRTSCLRGGSIGICLASSGSSRRASQVSSSAGVNCCSLAL